VRVKSLGVALALCLVLTAAPPATPALAGGGDGKGGDVTVTNPKSGRFDGRLEVSGQERSKSSGEKTTQTPKKRTLGKSTGPKLTLEQWRALKGMCRRMNQVFTCTTPPGKNTPPSRAHLVLDLGAMAKTLIVRLQLPDPTPQIGPDPSVNEWKMAAVGYPLWLWTHGPRTVTSRVRAAGITFTLQAAWQSTTYTMGDGHTLTCTRATPYSATVTPGTASPDCGYTYQTASLPHGSYTITATTHWRITWTALGATGTLPGTHTGTRTLPVGELNALVIR